MKIIRLYRDLEKGSEKITVEKYNEEKGICISKLRFTGIAWYHRQSIFLPKSKLPALIKALEAER